MALQNSGAISFADLRGEFLGSNPVSLSQYYRGGARVPATKTTTVTEYGNWSAYQYQPFSGTPRYYYVNNGEVRWNDVIVSGGSGGFEQGIRTPGDGYQYERGADQGGGQFSVRRRTITITEVQQNVNTSVPQSGQVSLSNYYGTAR